MMEAPRKIDPDNLRDTIVQVAYTCPPSIPDSIVSARVHEYLTGHKFNMIVSGSQQVQPFIPSNLIALGQTGFTLYANDVLKIGIRKGQIEFNITQKYIGWHAYFPVVKGLLEHLFSNNLLASISLIQVRYISEFRNKTVFDYLKGESTILKTDKKQVNTLIRTQLEDGDYKIIITLADNNVRSTPENGIETFSLIDVDVQYHGPPITDLNALLDKINGTHEQQKSTFYGIISEDFVRERNPQY